MRQAEGHGNNAFTPYTVQFAICALFSRLFYKYNNQNSVHQ